MLTVITSEGPVNEEALLINELFEEGLEILHIRKPFSTLNELKMLLDKIHARHHDKIALHQHHEIANDYTIIRLHFTEALRLSLGEKLDPEMKQDKIFSTSIHDPSKLIQLSNVFNYTFLGPVFPSISKPGYNNKWENKSVIKMGDTPDIIAIGGIDESNAGEIRDLHFDGIGLLGAIWKNPPQATKTFKAIRALWN